MLRLLIMAGMDYVTGTTVSFKEGRWSSDAAFPGLAR
ncbi:MAG: phage holin family protein [Sutterella sp.]|nr:phage holin family protein [Sutterella sp.]